MFAASYSGLFKTFFDVLDKDALDGKPVLVAATAGTARHSLVLEHALRPLFSYLHAVVVPTGVFAATEDFGGTDGVLQKRVERAAAELAALVASRRRPVRRSPAAAARRAGHAVRAAAARGRRRLRPLRDQRRAVTCFARSSGIGS